MNAPRLTRSLFTFILIFQLLASAANPVRATAASSQKEVAGTALETFKGNPTLPGNTLTSNPVKIRPSSPALTSLSVEILSTPWAALDNNKPGAPDTPLVYVVEARVTNTGVVAAENVVINLNYNEDPLNNWTVLPEKNPQRRVLSLAAGTSYYAYWFARYTSVIGGSHTYSVSAVADNASLVSISDNFFGNPEAGKTIKTRGVLSTGNSGIAQVKSSVVVGVAFTVVVTYTLGTNPLNITFSPVGNPDFDPNINRLVSSSVHFYNDTGTVNVVVADRLYFPSVVSGAQHARASFVFLPLKANNTRICPFAAVGYSSNNKYDQFFCNATRGTIISLIGTLSYEFKKQVSTLVSQQGETINYTIRYTNTGTLPLTYAWVWDDPDPAMASAILSTVTPAYDPTATTTHRVAWFLGTIPEAGKPGNSGVLTFSAVIDGNKLDIVDKASLVNVASFGINPGGLPSEAALTTTATTAIQAPTIAIQKSDGLTTAEPGAALPYVIQINNSGSTLATSVVITDVLPANVTLSGQPSPAPTSQNGQVLVWNNLGPLAPTGTINITVPVIIGVKTANGTVLTNTASVSYSNQAGHKFSQKTAFDTTTVAGPLLTISKIDTPDPVLSGKWITYTLSYANTGPGSATHVIITDIVPGNTTYQSCSGGTACSQVSGLVTWNIGDVPPSGSGSVKLTVKVGDLLATGTLIQNNLYGILSDQLNFIPGTPITTLVNRNAAFFVGSTFVDDNGNGVFDVGEGTLSGITVTLPAATTPVVNTVSGSYRFRVETEGVVNLSASDWPGYFRTTAGSVNLESTLGITRTLNFGYAPTTSGFGVLYGTVFDDANHNGFLDAGEKGLSGVQISSAQATPQTVSTNQYGQYTLRCNTAGDVTVTETNPAGRVSTTPDTIQTTVALGSNNSSPVNFGDFSGIKITGQVFDDISVNGKKDPGETGVAGAKVTTGSSSFTTDSTGIYALYSPISGSPILISETDPLGYVSTNAEPGAGMLRVSPNSLQIPSPVSGSTYSGGDFGDVLVTSVITVTGQVWNDNGAGGGGLANGILDGAEFGLTGAVVSLNNGLAQTTGPDGTFSLYAPPNQQVTLTEANPAGYISTNAIPGNSATKVDNDTLTIGTLSGGATSRLNMFGDVLPQTVAVISGFVFNDQNEDGLLTPGEPVIPGALVTLEVSGGNTIAVHTNLEGKYQFAVAPGLDIRITSTGPGVGFHPTTPESLVMHPSSAGDYPGNNFGYTNDTNRMVIFGVVFDDKNSNGVMDFGELGLPGAVVWVNETMSVTTKSGVAAGSFTFSLPAVASPKLAAVREANPPGYRSTTPDNINVPLIPGTTSYFVAFGDTNNPNVASVFGVVFDDLNRNGIYEVNEPTLSGVTITLTVGTTQGKVVVTTLSYGQFSYGFTIAEAGYHTVSEQDPARPGYHSTTPDTVNLLIQLGNSYTVNFGDTQEGYVVYGTVFNDTSGDGIQNGTELGIQGVTVALSSGATITTNADGGYTFDIPAPGVVPYSMQVIETDPTGYHSTTPNTTLVKVSTPQRSYNVNFGDTNNQFVSSIFGTVFDDLNVNGAYDLEPGLPGVNLTIGTIASYSTLTNEWGQFTFVVEATGVYTVTETDAPGWVSTNAIPGSAAVSKVDANTLRFTMQSLGTGLDSNRFGDVLASQSVEITGMVWDDNGAGGGTRGDGIHNGTEPGLGGATVTLSTGMSQVTGNDGLFTLYGPHSQVITVQEQNPSGYLSSGSVAGINATRVNNDTLTVNALAGGQASSGNQFGDVATSSVAVISGIVFNDADGDGTMGVSETGIPNVTVRLDGVLTAITDASGHYSFLTPEAGIHQVVETDRTGYFSTTPNEVHLSVSLENNFTVNFGDALNNSAFATIFGTVFEDINQNANWDPTEPGIPGVTVHLDGGNVAVTDANGSYTFSTNVAGSHTVEETDPFAYVSTTPNQVILSVMMGKGYPVNYGDRQLCNCSKDSFEEDDTFTQASTILIGKENKQAHNFCDDAVDWISFTAEARGIYTITAWAKGVRADTYLALYDKDGKKLLAANDDFAGTPDFSSRIVWNALYPGKYYVEISNRGNLTRCSTDYEVWIEFKESPIRLIYLPLIARIEAVGAAANVAKSAAVEAQPVGMNPAQPLSTINLGALSMPGVFNPMEAIAPLGVITHTCADAYEVDDTWEQAKPIVPGVSQVHSFDSNPAFYAVDKDLVSFNIRTGDTVIFTTVLTNSVVALELFDKNGASLGVTGTNQLSWVATGYDRFYLSASSLTTNFGCAGVTGYLLTMEVQPRKWTFLPLIIK